MIYHFSCESSRNVTPILKLVWNTYVDLADLWREFNRVGEDVKQNLIVNLKICAQFRLFRFTIGLNKQVFHFIPYIKFNFLVFNNNLVLF